jgi:hypothetical protein
MQGKYITIITTITRRTLRHVREVMGALLPPMAPPPAASARQFEET